MSVRVALHHRTEYRYDRLVDLQPHVVRLRPAPHCRTPILGYSLTIEPAENFLNWQQDPYSNYLARLVFPKPSRQLTVQVDLIADLTAINPFDFFIEPQAEQFPFTYDDVLTRELTPYLETHPAGPRLADLVQSLRKPQCRTIDYLVEVNQRLQREVKYLIRMEPGVQSPEETLALRSGSCRDSAWLLAQVLRHLGLAARFVSGYLIQLAADMPALDGPSGPANDFTDLHAWTEVYVPGAGWIGMDPTSGLMAGEGHIPLACAADPLSAAAITGSFAWTPASSSPNGDAVHEDFSFEMSVVRLNERARVTKPYSSEQWNAIDALGEAIDEQLHALDVRLTMGGEPTFVSIDDRDAPEWNTTALGDMKRVRAAQLLERLRDELAPGALLFHGQGKWYPSESLPRWAFGCYWRQDGEPVWQDPGLFAKFDENYGFTSAEARAFITVLAETLGVPSRFCIPGYEDAWYYLWRERRLPSNVDPLQSELSDPEERARLAKVFEQGLNHVVGFALPLRRSLVDPAQWESGEWFLRREHLFLLPGDSPMGYRLPLDSLPWEVPEQRPQVIERATMAPRGPLPSRNELLPQAHRLTGAPVPPGARRFGDSHGAPVAAPQSAALVRTALCVEPRDGRLHVFMPPVATIEDYLELVSAIETAAADLSLPVLIEGYKPPFDPRMKHFQITPDPGVIEVNTPPSATWGELKQLTTTVYEAARQTRLCTEKFLVDGRHCGTGGGNHIVIGGPTPADSPILRRPDVLRSLIGCWHNHPSLSYLFSSLFVGPTSQAPRIDEARNDSLYELEIAFRQIPDGGGCPPWLIDRVFRHLLTDVTGNTHRAEFCIDKLYSPDSDDGRRGLVELRAFEMPPHAQMSLVQQLLLRSLISRFWQTPYRHKLARWGAELHDRFLLPHYVEADFDDLLDELRNAGFPFQKDWFEPHFEFRFPRIGSTVHRDVQLELRHAIEPWHVLGEDPGPGGTVRYVDSSVERLQLKVNGLTDSRHVVTCNGYRVPLAPTGVNGEFVAGVRFRAWQPPTCLHPTIGVHSPLVIDVYDTWNRRSIGGCQYHVMHRGGRSFDTQPVNAAEAETRRQSRFLPFGHSPQMWSLPAAMVHPEFPLTLDLRHVPEPAPASANARELVSGLESIKTRLPEVRRIETYAGAAP